MKRLLIGLPVLLVPLVLLACSMFGGDQDVLPGGEENSSSSVAQPILNEEDLVTKNVTYTGILEEGGVTLYQEGSHRLVLEDGKMLLLTVPAETNVDLSLYTGKLVKVKGDVRSTVEAGGTIMTVREIHWIRREPDADGNEQEVLHVLCGGKTTCGEGEVCALQEDGTGICEVQTVSSSSSSVSSASSVSSVSSSSISSSSVASSSSSISSSVASAVSSSVSTSSSVSSSAAAAPPSNRYEAALALMLEEDYAPARWTQEYCTEHVGFCVPVHKNWYFKSFGAMTSVLWRVEMGGVDVEQMGDGPLVVELKSGTLASIGVEDKAVREVGGKVIGYRVWSPAGSAEQHFEISAPSAGLTEPVRFVTEGLKAI